MLRKRTVISFFSVLFQEDAFPFCLMRVLGRKKCVCLFVELPWGEEARNIEVLTGSTFHVVIAWKKGVLKAKPLYFCPISGYFCLVIRLQILTCISHFVAPRSLEFCSAHCIIFRGEEQFSFECLNT